MIFRYRRFRPNLGLLPRLLLAAAIACVVILAFVGAVFAAVLLAIGAVVHWLVRQFRPIAGTQGPEPQAQRGAQVFEGEFSVVQPSQDAPRALSVSLDRRAG